MILIVIDDGDDYILASKNEGNILKHLGIGFLNSLGIIILMLLFWLKSMLVQGCEFKIPQVLC